MAYARAYFAMNTRGKDGATTRAHLETAARMGSVTAKAELAKLVTTPGPLGYLWGWFLELHTHRGMGGMGPAPITWPDLQAWSALMQRALDPWEYALLGVLDNEYFATKGAA